MQKIFTLLFIVISVNACSEKNKNQTADNTLTKTFTVYSNAVQDSFVISVQLPENYHKDSAAKYPVVFLLDANFHFPILAATLRQCEDAEFLPPLILVGIGYKSFELWDSLRVRDFMYPAALPSDEINASGGGKKFDEFIITQLIPYIDSNYRTDKSNRSLLGHSFGGYFSLYALLNQLQTNRNDFKNFVAASPSLWYNNFYLNQLTTLLKTKNKDSLSIFMSVGGLEDSTWNISPVKKMGNEIIHADIKQLHLKYSVFNDLGHMEVAELSFLKGLQQFYNKASE